MKKKSIPPVDAAELRRRAESRLKEKKKGQVRKGATPLSADEMQRLLQELQIHEIELEMQNKELAASRADVEAGLALYTDLYDFAPVGYLTLGRDGTIRRANLTGARLLNVERGRLAGRRFGLFVSEADRPAFNTFLQKIFTSRAKETCEVTLSKEEKNPPSSARSGIRRFEGTDQLVVHVGAVASEDGQECRAVMTDITERKQAEEALRSKQMMLARTEGIANIGSWAWNIATDKVTWSDELFRIFQRDPREGAPSFAEHPAFYHPEDMARLRQAVEAAITDGTSYELELRAIRKDGETRVCVARGISEMELGGRTVSLFGSFQDITDRKRVEEELRRTLDSLRKAFDTIIKVMVSTIETRDPYTAGHMIRVFFLADPAEQASLCQFSPPTIARKYKS